MESSIDFGELSNDENFKKTYLDLKKSLDDVSKVLDTFLSQSNYDQLSLEDKVRYDLFLAFAINTFYWVYLRTKGIDPNTHEIKQQINRVRDYMTKSKKIYEKKTLMPRLDQEATKRFVRSGLWTPNASTSSNVEPQTSTQVPDVVTTGSRKRKRDDGDDK